MIGVIYCLKCPYTNEVKYIGQTIKSTKIRLAGHMSACNARDSKVNYWLRKLKRVNKKPSIEVIEEVIFDDIDELSDREIYWIKYFKDLGINLKNTTTGGFRGYTYSYDKAKIVTYQYDLNGLLLKKWESITDAAKSLNIDIGGIVKCCKGNRQKAGNFLWSYDNEPQLEYKRYKNKVIKNFSSEGLQNIIKANNKKIIQVNMEGDILNEWESTSIASINLSIGRTAIINCLTGRSKTAGGYVWKYV